MSGVRASSGSAELIGVTVSFDYCFQGASDEGEEADGRDDQTVWIMHDDSIDGMWALQVESKGVRAEVADWIMLKLEEAGHAGAELTLKSDQEESIIALKRAVASRRNSRTTLIEPQVRVSKTNAKVERAIARWRSHSAN